MGICGVNCNECPIKNCAGCEKTCGKPFGGNCFAYKCITLGGMDSFNQYKNKLISEINELNISGMPEIDNLYCLKGSFVNLEYPISDGIKIKLLKDENIYLGTPVKCEFNDDTIERCYGIIGSTDFIIVAEYGENGSDPELIMYKKR